MSDVRIAFGGQRYAIVEVYRDDVHGSTSWLVLGGQKRYLRHWDEADRWEWSWVLNEKAQKVR